jgi:hypothetical protein
MATCTHFLNLPSKLSWHLLAMWERSPPNSARTIGCSNNNKSTHDNNRAPHLGCCTLPWHRKVDTRQRGQKIQARSRNKFPHLCTPAAASVEQLYQSPAQCTPKLVPVILTMHCSLATVRATDVGSQRPAHPISKAMRKCEQVSPDRRECRLPHNGTPTRQKLAHAHYHRRKGRKYYLHAITKSQLLDLQE